MATIATIQVLLIDGEQEDCHHSLAAIRAHLIKSGLAVDVRIADADGPLLQTGQPVIELGEGPDASASTPAFQEDLYSLPQGRSYAAVHDGAGEVTIHFQHKHAEGVETICAHASATSRKVRVELRSAAALADAEARWPSASLLYASSARVSRAGSDANPDVVYDAVDRETGKKVAGLLCTVPAFAHFDGLSVCNGQAVPLRVRLFDVYEQRFAQTVQQVGDSNVPSPIFLTHSAEPIGFDRIQLVPRSAS